MHGGPAIQMPRNFILISPGDSESNVTLLFLITLHNVILLFLDHTNQCDSVVFGSHPSNVILLSLDHTSQCDSVVFGSHQSMWFCCFWITPLNVILFFWITLLNVILLFLDHTKQCDSVVFGSHPSNVILLFLDHTTQCDSVVFGSHPSNRWTKFWTSSDLRVNKTGNFVPACMAPVYFWHLSKSEVFCFQRSQKLNNHTCT